MVDHHSYAADQDCQEDKAMLSHSWMTWHSSLTFYLEREHCRTLMQCSIQLSPQSFLPLERHDKLPGFDPTYQWEEGGKATRGCGCGEGSCNL